MSQVFFSNEHVEQTRIRIQESKFYWPHECIKVKNQQDYNAFDIETVGVLMPMVLHCIE